MPHEGSLLLRFLAKLAFEIVPAALASVVGGILFTHYQIGYGAPKPAVEQAAPASAEMVRLLRDEHSAIVDFLKAQTEVEKSRLAAEDEASARSVAEAKAAAAAAAVPAVVAAVPAVGAVVPAVAPAAPARRPGAIAPAVKVAANKGRVLAAATTSVAPRAPLVIAQVEQSSAATPAPPPAGNSESLLSKTLDIKDRVVDATRRVIDTIGSIPSMIASGGDHAGTSNASAPPAGRLVGASS